MNLRCGRCGSYLDEILWHINGPVLGGDDHHLLPGSIHGDRCMYRCCFCLTSYTVTISAALNAATHAHTLGQDDIWAGRTAYGVRVPDANLPPLTSIQEKPL